MHLYNRLKRCIIWTRTVVPLEKRNVFVIYFIILLGTTLDNMNTATAFTLQNNIQEAFHTDSSTASWVLSGYALTLGSFIMVSGKIADVIGPHNTFLFGLAIIWISALVCACIPHTSIIPLIVFRAIQGIGGSALIPSTLALAANYFSGDKAKYLPTAILCFILALVGVFGGAVILGGAFSLTSIGYRGFFWLVFGWAFVVDLLLLFLIIPIEETEEHKNLKMKNIDFPGAALSIIGALLMILGLTEGGENWRKPKAYIPLIIGFFTFLASLILEVFIKRYQVKHSNENKSTWILNVQLLYPPEIIKIPNFLVFLITTGLYYAAFTMIHTTLIYYYELIELNPSIIVALKVLPFSVGLIFGTVCYRPKFYQKIGIRYMFILTAAICVGSVIWLSRTNYSVENSFWKFALVPLFLYGYGANTFFNMYVNVVVAHTPLHLQGVVNGIYQGCSQVCLSMGSALVPSIVGNIKQAHTETAKRALHNRFQPVFYVLMAFHVVILLIMIFLLKDKASTMQDEECENNSLLSIDIENLSKHQDTDAHIFEKDFIIDKQEKV